MRNRDRRKGTRKRIKSRLRWPTALNIRPSSIDLIKERTEYRERISRKKRRERQRLRLKEKNIGTQIAREDSDDTQDSSERGPNDAVRNAKREEIKRKKTNDAMAPKYENTTGRNGSRKKFTGKRVGKINPPLSKFAKSILDRVRSEAANKTVKSSTSEGGYLRNDGDKSQAGESAQQNVHPRQVKGQMELPTRTRTAKPFGVKKSKLIKSQLDQSKARRQDRTKSSGHEVDEPISRHPVAGHDKLRKEKSTLYDAVAGRMCVNGYIRPKGTLSDFQDGPETSQVPIPADEVLFRRNGAPVRYQENDKYFAHSKLGHDQELPSSDLLKALHVYVSDFNTASTYTYSQRRRSIHFNSLDETALLAMGILLEEAAKEALGETGHLAFVEGENKDTFGCSLVDPNVRVYGSRSVVFKGRPKALAKYSGSIVDPKSIESRKRAWISASGKSHNIRRKVD
ncbi:hypothetical protein M501DRAFT_965761 [Patellaria atrata CBS 101060]|uniref:Uncharacterized protein n=1 Tax=Patellaria atrata CBS 101060 TaxID=1346257 RepID=A0A9P4VWN9_9PEZI|nr:hypothetical protein M501DRAFT_965761 [Patellaria atrata CBS 101060]